MSDKMTVVAIYDDGDGETEIIGERGHVPADEAVERLLRYARQQQAEADRILAALDRGNVRVYHQRGVHVARDRKEVLP